MLLPLVLPLQHSLLPRRISFSSPVSNACCLPSMSMTIWTSLLLLMKGGVSIAVPTLFTRIPASGLLSLPTQPFGSLALICWLRSRLSQSYAYVVRYATSPIPAIAASLLALPLPLSSPTYPPSPCPTCAEHAILLVIKVVLNSLLVRVQAKIGIYLRKCHAGPGG